MSADNGSPISTGPVRTRRGADEAACDQYDALVRRMFAVGLDLHAALALVDNCHAADKIWRAIDELDETINEVRDIVSSLV